MTIMSYRRILLFCIPLTKIDHQSFHIFIIPSQTNQKYYMLGTTNSIKAFPLTYSHPRGEFGDLYVSTKIISYHQVLVLFPVKSICAHYLLWCNWKAQLMSVFLWSCLSPLSDAYVLRSGRSTKCFTLSLDFTMPWRPVYSCSKMYFCTESQIRMCVPFTRVPLSTEKSPACWS